MANANLLAGIQVPVSRKNGFKQKKTEIYNFLLVEFYLTCYSLDYWTDWHENWHTIPDRSEDDARYVCLQADPIVTVITVKG